MPTPPKTAAKAAAQVKLQTWDEYVAEIVGDIEPWQKELPDGTLLEAPFPSSDAMDAMNAAQTTQDARALLVACFGDEQGEKVHEMVRKLPFVVPLRMVNDIVKHYVGTELEGMGESGASPS